MASIIIMSGAKNEYFPLERKICLIGRSENIPIQILDEYVSRRHLRIRFDRRKKCYYAADLSSKHGVFINGSKIEAETVLKDEDRIRIGDTTILFLEQDFPDSQSALLHLRKTGESKYPTQLE
ncbi:MAG: FHA domain-containing protein [Planctomycetota bacterium]|jgi:pSer/pThr/pTyr-binding forkhead associated (FHA) protein